jgi:hypothetical protein
MAKQKQALSYGVTAIAILAGMMFLFYYLSDRFRTSEFELDLRGGTGAYQKEEVSEFVGLYSPYDGPLEADDKRISFFTVNRREEGGYLGSAKVDTIGSSEHYFFRCVDVKIEESDFFINCFHESEGAISLNGHWQRDNSDSIQVIGKVLWTKNGRPLLDIQRRFNHMAGD